MNAAEIARECRELVESLPRHQPKRAERLRAALAEYMTANGNQRPPLADVDEHAMRIGFDLWPALIRLHENLRRPPDLWPHDLIDDLNALAAACKGESVSVKLMPSHAPALQDAPVAEDKAANPAALAQAIPGNRAAVGDTYRTAAAWLRDGKLCSRLAAIGAVLRDVQNKKPADAVWKAAQVPQVKGRQDTAEFYRVSSRWLAKGAEGRMPADLAGWLAERLGAMADAIEADAKPANAIYRACGAGRHGQAGRGAAKWTEWRNEAIRDDLERMRRMHPGRNDQAHYLTAAERWFPAEYHPAKPGESESDRVQRYAELVKNISRINSLRA